MKQNFGFSLIFSSINSLFFSSIICIIICLTIFWPTVCMAKPQQQHSIQFPNRFQPLNEREISLYKKSDTPQWEDLGWAWGKKRSSPPIHPPILSTEYDSDDDDDENIKFYGSGGSSGGGALNPNFQKPALLRNYGRISAKELRALQAMVKKDPDWHALGWAWG